MARVAFISHASEDAAIAAAITEYLESNGVSCWLAPRDVTPGSEYSAEIVDGIESSAVFVLVLSENANASIYVKREVERAVSKGKPIFPIRVREVMPSKSLELFVSSAHWIDAWTPPLEKYLERLAHSISSAAAVYPAATPVAAPMASKIGRRPRQDRRVLAAALAAMALVVVGAGGWYGRALLGPSEPSPSVVELPPGSDSAAPAAQQVAPAAGPLTPTVTAARQAAPPASDAGQLCPRNLSINREMPTPFTCVCSGAAARSNDGAVWGTDVYTDDSDLCRAAVHAGVIGSEGGTVTVVRGEGRPLYIGSARNGVSSNDYGSFDPSIAFVGAPGPAPGPEPCPRNLSINRELPMPFSCACSSPATRRDDAAVWGTDVYTDDSDLCRAAVHAGAIGLEGGTVTVIRSEGRPLYVGSARHGVSSHDYGSWDPSIRFQ